MYRYLSIEPCQLLSNMYRYLSIESVSVTVKHVSLFVHRTVSDTVKQFSQSLYFRDGIKLRKLIPANVCHHFNLMYLRPNRRNLNAVKFPHPKPRNLMQRKFHVLQYSPRILIQFCTSLSATTQEPKTDTK